MRLIHKNGGKQRNFSLKARALLYGARGFARNSGDGADIGELLVAHLHSLLQDLLPRGVGQTVRVVDGLGDRVARHAQRVCNILDRNFLHGKTSILFHSGILSQFPCRCQTESRPKNVQM